MPFKGYKQTEEHKRNIKDALRGRHPKTEFKKGYHSPTEFKKGYKRPHGWKKRIHLSEKHKKHLSENHADFRGKKHWNWQGGVAYYRDTIEQSPEYKQWRKAIFERDGYTCLVCGEVGGRLNAHHIKSFKKYPEVRFEVNNGITLCIDCHCLNNLHKEI